VKIQSPNNLKCGSKKEVKFICFVDMDGVMTYWLKAACDVCGIDIHEKDLYSKLKDENMLLDKTGYIKEKDMWSKIDKAGTDFWANLEILPWAKKLIAEMKKLGDVYFLTSPGTCIPAPSGKMEWIEKHFPDLLEKLIICKDKEMCANKNTILIDDSEKKIEAFRDAGGHAFLWPNCLKLLDEDIDVDETLEQLVEEIKGYICG